MSREFELLFIKRCGSAAASSLVPAARTRSARPADLPVTAGPRGICHEAGCASTTSSRRPPAGDKTEAWLALGGLLGRTGDHDVPAERRRLPSDLHAVSAARADAPCRPAGAATGAVSSGAGRHQSARSPGAARRASPRDVSGGARTDTRWGARGGSLRSADSPRRSRLRAREMGTEPRPLKDWCWLKHGGAPRSG